MSVATQVRIARSCYTFRPCCCIWNRHWLACSACVRQLQTMQTKKTLNASPFHIPTLTRTLTAGPQPGPSQPVCAEGSKLLQVGMPFRKMTTKEQQGVHFISQQSAQYESHPALIPHALILSFPGLVTPQGHACRGPTGEGGCMGAFPEQAPACFHPAMPISDLQLLCIARTLGATSSLLLASSGAGAHAPQQRAGQATRGDPLRACGVWPDWQARSQIQVGGGGQGAPGEWDRLWGGPCHGPEQHTNHCNKTASLQSIHAACLEMP